MATVTASGLTKNIGARTLFSGVSFKLTPGERMALSGRNGSGKTTLLRILAGESGLDAGSVSMRSGVRVVLHDQRPPRSDSTTLREYVLTGLGWILVIEEELAELERRMSAGESGDDVLGAYARAQGRLDHAGGYRWRDTATAAVRGLGFGDAELDRPLEGFSGGELTRASLARALAAKPELLLLDGRVSDFSGVVRVISTKSAIRRATTARGGRLVLPDTQCSQSSRSAPVRRPGLRRCRSGHPRRG